ncbi:hypothetical protein AMECASPLE_015773 [Ameca splendens]|uniref:Uncharacterized protein n=1 Tax=Ameca splendens TaxID=208324 RepID=A0ABV0Y2F8_9TELE
MRSGQHLWKVGYSFMKGHFRVGAVSINVCKCVTSVAVAVCFSLCQDWHSAQPEEPTSNEISLLARCLAAMASANTEKDILRLDTHYPRDEQVVWKYTVICA